MTLVGQGGHPWTEPEWRGRTRAATSALSREDGLLCARSESIWVAVGGGG